MPKQPRHLKPRTAYTAIRDQYQPFARCIARRCAMHRIPVSCRAEVIAAQVDAVLADNGGRVPTGVR